VRLTRDAPPLLAGDRIVAIDGLRPRDVIDLQLELPVARSVCVERHGDQLEIPAPTNGFEPAALALDEPVPGGIRECNNYCEFCFIRGLPQGLRSSLYIFDDDYRYSFLWGNFLTLTNLHEADWARIGFQRLSPLNVSVHATDPAVRRRMLNNRHAPDILPQLDRLARLGIQVNTQVVLCAAVNDGEVLERTIADLAARHPTVATVSVVPVGLTRFSKVRNIRRPSTAEAAVAVAQIDRWQTSLRKSLRVGFVYASDELHVLAGAPIPTAAYYDGFPILTNGVGLLRSMIDDWERLPKKRVPPRKVAFVTGQLAAPALEHIADSWQDATGWRPTVHAVDNDLFGSEVTVSGLLTGANLIQALRSIPPAVEDVVLPRSPFGFDGETTLDGVSAREIGDAHPGKVHIAASPAELLAILARTDR
jgi:putative radical SAM enzyme (TIGR03279 family)